MLTAYAHTHTELETLLWYCILNIAQSGCRPIQNAANKPYAFAHSSLYCSNWRPEANEANGTAYLLGTQAIRNSYICMSFPLIQCAKTSYRIAYPIYKSFPQNWFTETIIPKTMLIFGNRVLVDEIMSVILSGWISCLCMGVLPLPHAVLCKHTEQRIAASQVESLNQKPSQPAPWVAFLSPWNIEGQVSVVQATQPVSFVVVPRDD